MWEEAFYELSVAAARQQGMISGAQAQKLGVGPTAIDTFLSARLLTELDWDVYQLVSSTLGPRFAYPYAAWLAIRPDVFHWERADGPADVVVSHESACGVLGLGSVSVPVVTFIAAEEREAPRATRIQVARVAPEEITTCRGIPVTTAHRTILDLVRDWVGHGDIQRVITDAVRRDLVDLRSLYEDMVPLAEEHEFPTAGPEFVGYFMQLLQPEGLSVRNLRAYSELVSGERVSAVRPRVAEVLTEFRRAFDRAGAGSQLEDENLSRDIAAEIVGRVGW